MSDVDTSAEAVERLATELCARWDDVWDFLVCREEAAATLRALLAERDELRASFDLRWKADMRAIRLRREQDQDDDNLTWPDHADLVVWLLAERDRLAAEVARMREALRHVAFHAVLLQDARLAASAALAGEGCEDG